MTTGTTKLIKRLLKAGITEIVVIPSYYQDHDSRPILLVSPKQADRLFGDKPKKRR